MFRPLSAGITEDTRRIDGEDAAKNSSHFKNPLIASL